MKENNMDQDLLRKLYLAIEEQVEEEMNKVGNALLEQFKEQLKVQQTKAICEIMKNVSVSFKREVDDSINYSITFKNIVDKEK